MEEETGRIYPIKFTINSKDALTLRNLNNKGEEFSKKQEEE
jgi:hypothetical protein